MSTPITGTGPVGAADSSHSTHSPSSNPLNQAGNGLGENAFLQLLVTQLQHQDPLQPQDDSAFVAQLAQFSSLEQLTQIDSSIHQLVTLATGGGTNANTGANTSTNGTNGTSGSGGN